MYLINSVFRDYLDLLVIVLIDDIFIYSNNENAHKSHLRLALHVIKKHQLYVEFSKCEFWFSLVAFLDHFISTEGENVNPNK